MSLHQLALNKDAENLWLALLDGQDVNSTATVASYENATPLMIACGEGSFDCFVALLLSNADVNAVDSNGFSAVHYAGKRAKVESTPEQLQIVHFLYMFDANRCGRQPLGTCTEYCSCNEGNRGEGPVWEGKHRDDPVYIPDLKFAAYKPDEEIGKVLIAIDGGGIRGAGPILSILYFERCMSKMLGKKVNLIDYVDFLAGTSTGAIIALALTSGITAERLLAMYMKLKDRVFTGFKPYSSAVLGSFLMEELGDITMDELGKKIGNLNGTGKQKKVLIVTSKGDEECPEPILFRTHVPPGDATTEEEISLTNPKTVKAWQVGQWSASAPKYFTIESQIFYDGGLVANNPTPLAMDEMIKTKLYERDYRNRSYNMIINLGTGIEPIIPMETSEMDIRFTYPEIIQFPSKCVSAAGVLTNLSTKSSGIPVKTARNLASVEGADFFRYSPPLSEPVKLDETNNATIRKMLFEFLIYLRENHRFVELMCQKLIALKSSQS